MAYNAQIPQASDRLKDSQGQLLANFQALEPFGNSFALLSPLGADPTTAATQTALYAKQSTFLPQQALFIRRENNDANPIEFTYFTGSTNGVTRLPSGILLKWGSSNVVAGSNAVTYPVGATIMPFTSIFSIQVTPFSAVPTIFNVVISSTGTITGFTVQSSGSGSIRYLAIGV